ncbi:MAG TPA: hypothetical protein VMX33_09020 [bacterium]|nr:hypothetical protein [bacterium]
MDTTETEHDSPAGNGVSAFGKRVFFLNPQPVILEVASILADAEFEVYTTRDHGRLARYLRKDPDCLTFVNIDEGDDEGVWRTWIKSIRDDKATNHVAFGVVTTLDDEDKKSAYLMNLGVECGFIVVKMGAAKTAEILLRTLEANEARGRRKYVRAMCPPDAAEFNCTTDAGVLGGMIRDLSSVGMSASFTGGISVRTGTRLKDMQLIMRGIRVIVTGVVIGSHDAAGLGTIVVIMFEPASLTDDKRNKLRAFIRKTLQAAMDHQLSLV